MVLADGCNTLSLLIHDPRTSRLGDRRFADMSYFGWSVCLVLGGRQVLAAVSQTKQIALTPNAKRIRNKHQLMQCCRLQASNVK